jgi:hypothetical protein
MGRILWQKKIPQLMRDKCFCFPVSLDGFSKDEGNKRPWFFMNVGHIMIFLKIELTAF